MSATIRLVAHNICLIRSFICESQLSTIAILSLVVADTCRKAERDPQYGSVVTSEVISEAIQAYVNNY